MSMESSTTRTTACIHLSGRDSDVTVTDCQMGNKGESGSLSYFCHPQLTVKACRLAVSVTDQNSFLSLVSSIVISLNSLDSKTSPHSRHSTNSESSSRATMRTRGCLQVLGSAFIAGICAGWDRVIDSGLHRSGRVAPRGNFAGIGRIFSFGMVVVKPEIATRQTTQLQGFIHRDGPPQMVWLGQHIEEPAQCFLGGRSSLPFVMLFPRKEDEWQTSFVWAWCRCQLR